MSESLKLKMGKSVGNRIISNANRLSLKDDEWRTANNAKNASEPFIWVSGGAIKQSSH